MSPLKPFVPQPSYDEEPLKGNFPEGSRIQLIANIDETTLTSLHDDVADIKYKEISLEWKDAKDHYTKELCKQRYPDKEVIEKEELDAVRKEAEKLVKAYMKAKYKDIYKPFMKMKEEWRRIMMSNEYE